MYFTIEEENLICLYHKSDRRRTAGAIQAVLPEVNEDMAALARQSLDKLEAMSDAAFEAQFPKGANNPIPQKAPGAGLYKIFRVSNPFFDTSNVTVCSSAGIIRFGCSFVSTFPIYRLRQNQANKEKEATLPFVEKVTSDSGGNDNNTQIYSRNSKKKSPIFQGFPRCFSTYPPTFQNTTGNPNQFVSNR